MQLELNKTFWSTASAFSHSFSHQISAKSFATFPRTSRVWSLTFTWHCRRKSIREVWENAGTRGRTPILERKRRPGERNREYQKHTSLNAEKETRGKREDEGCNGWESKLSCLFKEIFRDSFKIVKQVTFPTFTGKIAFYCFLSFSILHILIQSRKHLSLFFFYIHVYDTWCS